MFALMLAALADTVFVPVDIDIVLLHEWGVVEIDTYSSFAVGAPTGEELPLFYDIDYCVEAPVVWFHGSDFTGKLTVTSPEGHLTVTYPEPDRVEQDPAGMPVQAVWSLEGHSVFLTEQTPLPVEEIPMVEEEVMVDGERLVEPPSTGFDWARDLWRRVPSLGLVGTTGNWRESFIYYESQVDDLFGTPPDDAGYDWLVRDLDVPAMVFMSGPEALSLMCPVDMTGEMPSLTEGDFEVYDREVMLAMLCSWAGGGFKSEEITALLDTWERRLTTVPYGENVVLFPIPMEYWDRISTLTLETEQGYDVEYKRLFLGLIVLRAELDDA